MVGVDSSIFTRQKEERRISTNTKSICMYEISKEMSFRTKTTYHSLIIEHYDTCNVKVKRHKVTKSTRVVCRLIVHISKTRVWFSIPIPYTILLGLSPTLISIILYQKSPNSQNSFSFNTLSANTNLLINVVLTRKYLKDENILFDNPKGMTLIHNAWWSKKGDIWQIIGFDHTKSKLDFSSYI